MSFEIGFWSRNFETLRDLGWIHEGLCLTKYTFWIKSILGPYKTYRLRLFETISDKFGLDKRFPSIEWKQKTAESLLRSIRALRRIKGSTYLILTVPASCSRCAFKFWLPICYKPVRLAMVCGSWILQEWTTVTHVHPLIACLNVVRGIESLVSKQSSCPRLSSSEFKFSRFKMEKILDFFDFSKSSILIQNAIAWKSYFLALMWF